MPALASPPSIVAPVSPATLQLPVSDALTGAWTGVLEYRDYRSDARIKLPTWLVVQGANQALRFDYIYDDGPSKVVAETATVAIDAAKATYTVLPILSA